MGAEDSLRGIRWQKIEEMKQEGVSLYPNRFRNTTSTDILQQRFHDVPGEDLQKLEERFALAGRVVALRNFGKSCFAHLQDGQGKVQLYFQKNILGEASYDRFKRWVDIGDILGVEGHLFRTRTGELTLKVDRYQILSKALRSMPEKFHGLKDVELRYRKRYLDLIANPTAQSIFQKRAAIIQRVRRFFDEKGFLEVETPMMHPIPGGAAARPFSTYHNALDQSLYLRIAPELYLKRLLVGGLEKVYELNKNFRNEGVSTRHNPEFTMIEFYQAYADYEDFMSLTEELVCAILKDVQGTHRITFQGLELDFTPPWKRITLEQSLEQVAGFSSKDLEDMDALRTLCRKAGAEPPKNASRGELLVELFELTVEERLQQPTFVTHYPLEVSPLARSSEDTPGFVDRFELFIAGRECANGFSELNDPEEQRRRFNLQMEKRRQGDEEAQQMDEDFLEALEFGMPPAAGEGIGIDRLVMILTDSASIRDVIAFPQMRPDLGTPQKP